MGKKAFFLLKNTMKDTFISNFERICIIKDLDERPSNVSSVASINSIYSTGNFIICKKREGE